MLGLFPLFFSSLFPFLFFLLSSFFCHSFPSSKQFLLFRHSSSLFDKITEQRNTPNQINGLN
ncbi:hypothetical protein LguiB_015616 [Lonicera macranthoides]